ncbi:MAG: L-fucose:H+ symporter permease [Bacteroidales bacterium]|nr:L-fucose:H+ symporter permease [Bacteroidales bacterium]
MNQKTKKTNVSLVKTEDGINYLFPFILISSLFLLWGFAHGLLDVLNKHFQNILHVSKMQSGFVQFSLYIGYLVMAIPAGLIMKRFGYKRGIVFGLSLFAIGAFLFYPAAKLESFYPFLIALFVIASGLACLETAANPYSTVLGPKQYAARRINLSQSFNGLGWILGPLLGGLFIFGAQTNNTNGSKFDSLIFPYMLVGGIVIVVLLVFLFTKLPDVKVSDESEQEENPPMKHLLKHPAFIVAVVAQFLYVAAQTGINSFFINFVTEEMSNTQTVIGNLMLHMGGFGRVFMPQSNEQAASLILALGGMGSFFIGRLTGAFFMKYIAPQKLLAFYAIANVILTVLVISKLGWLSVIALFSTYFFMSVMFPTIFALGIKDLGTLTKKGSSFLVMAVAGGAFCPPIMGAIADTSSMSVAFIIPAFCFAFIAYYAILGTKLKSQHTL